MAMALENKPLIPKEPSSTGDKWDWTLVRCGCPDSVVTAIVRITCLKELIDVLPINSAGNLLQIYDKHGSYIFINHKSHDVSCIATATKKQCLRLQVFKRVIPFSPQTWLNGEIPNVSIEWKTLLKILINGVLCNSTFRAIIINAAVFVDKIVLEDNVEMVHQEIQVSIHPCTSQDQGYLKDYITAQLSAILTDDNSFPDACTMIYREDTYDDATEGWKCDCGNLFK